MGRRIKIKIKCYSNKNIHILSDKININSEVFYLYALDAAAVPALICTVNIVKRPEASKAAIG